MSSNISIFLSNNISKLEFYNFLISIDAKKQILGEFEQGVMTFGEATIWIYYRGNNFNIDSSKKEELCNYLKTANTEIFVEISSDDGSELLAKNLCEKIFIQFGDLVILNDEGLFFKIEKVKNALYITN